MIDLAQTANGGIKKYVGKEFGYTGLFSMPSMLGSGTSIYNPDSISLNTYAEMCEYSQIQACLTVIKMPIIRAGWSIKCEEQGIADFVQKALKKIWIALIRDMLTAIEFGYSPLTKRFVLDENGKVVWNKFLPLDPRTVTINTIGSSFAGFTQNSIPISPEMCLLFSPDQRFGNLYGRSRLKAAYDHWFAAKYIYQFANRYFELFVSPQKVVRHPEGQTQTGTDESGNPTYTANYTIAQNIGNSLQNAGTLIMPANPVIDGKEVPVWVVDLLERKAGLNGGKDYEDYINHLDVKIARAMFVPDLTFSQGNNVTGSNAMASSHADVFMASEEGLLDLVKECIDTYVLPQIVTYNFGTSAPPATWEYEGLTSETKEMLKQIFVEMVKGSMLRPDPEWISEQFGVKLSEEKPEETPAQGPKQAPVEVKPPAEEEEPEEGAKTEKGFFAHIADFFKKKSHSFEAESRFWRALTPAEVASGIDFSKLQTKMIAADEKIRGKMEEALLSEAKKYIRQARKQIRQGISWGDLLEKLESIEMSVPDYRRQLEEEIRALWNEARDIFARSYKIAKSDWPAEVAQAIGDKAEFIARTHTYKVKEEMLTAAQEGYSAGLSAYALEEKLKTAAEQWVKAGNDLRSTAQITVTENINLAFATQAELSQEFAAIELSAILDEVTCSYCRSVDGAQFDILDKKAQEYRSPFHFGCRCLWIYVRKEDTDGSESGPPNVSREAEENRTFYPGEPYVPKWLDEAMKGASIKRKKAAIAIYNAQLQAAGANKKLMDELRKKRKKKK